MTKLSIKIPPRPFLKAALKEQRPKIKKALRDAIRSSMSKSTPGMRPIITPLTNSVANTLKSRGKVRGDFAEDARIAQGIKQLFRSGQSWARMNDTQREAADQMAIKLARAVNGDPSDPENWHDIQGYGKLVEDRL